MKESIEGRSDTGNAGMKDKKRMKDKKEVKDMN